MPGATGAVVSMFAAPILGGIAGPVAKYVLDKLKGNWGAAPMGSEPTGPSDIEALQRFIGELQATFATA